MRALARFRWLVPALAIPVCTAAAGITIQAAAFGRAPEDSLVATGVLRELVRYHAMRGTETLGARPLSATCIQGWFRLPRRRLAHGALVLLGNGERLFDVGSGVRRLVGVSHSRRFATDLSRGRPVEAVGRRSDGENASAIVARSRHAELTLAVTHVTYKPIALSFSEGRFRGTTDLVPGGGAAAIRRVRRAFGLATHNRGAHA